jgi:hypothetical protein
MEGAEVEGGGPHCRPGDGGGTSLGPGADLAQVPASLHALPQLNSIIRACWQQKEHRRPSAAQVHDMLVALMREHANVTNME